MERIVNREGLNIFVDYAHTPDALQNAISDILGKRILKEFWSCLAVEEIAIKAKRPLMGEAVAKLADIAIPTSE